METSQVSNDSAHRRVRRAVASGGVLGVASLPGHLFLDHTTSVLIAALTLVLIAGVYLGYAFSDGRVKIIAMEGTVAALFTGAAFYAVTTQPWAVPVAYVAHGAWDVLHHRHVGTTMPRWYVPFCAIYDWVTAAGLTAIWLTQLG